MQEDELVELYLQVSLPRSSSASSATGGTAVARVVTSVLGPRREGRPWDVPQAQGGTQGGSGDQQSLSPRYTW